MVGTAQAQKPPKAEHAK